jgi:signal peptidase II
LIVFFAALVAADQATKILAARHLDGREAIRLAGGFVSLQYAENPGAFLSLGASLAPAVRTALFVVISGVFLAFLAVQTLRDGEAGRTRTFAVTAIVAGGVGNVIDRIAFGIVRDFAVVGLPAVSWLRTGVFNLADLAITTGVIVLALEVWVKRHRGGQAGRSAEPTEGRGPSQGTEAQANEVDPARHEVARGGDAVP